MRMLLVEDDLSIQHFLTRALEEAGYQVDAAGTAKLGEALAVQGIHDVGDSDGKARARCSAIHPDRSIEPKIPRRGG